ncbi:hypothetical protein V6N12_038679 [Hibiscus sabdariffa]|uniref:Uncharacterized protein n=1 Tax=Hibiscus sabdariffa TaxID=183260 RepID=A0ABR2CB19_9ROSI
MKERELHYLNVLQTKVWFRKRAPIEQQIPKESLSCTDRLNTPEVPDVTYNLRTETMIPNAGSFSVQYEILKPTLKRVKEK